MYLYYLIKIVYFLKNKIVDNINKLLLIKKKGGGVNKMNKNANYKNFLFKNLKNLSRNLLLIFRINVIHPISKIICIQ